jgi:hypothetical protein
MLTGGILRFVIKLAEAPSTISTAVMKSFICYDSLTDKVMHYLLSPSARTERNEGETDLT